ncbi:flavin reductase family protein [Microbacterium gorillae]|uniref:flavin reductase family protein n=1 Tax=Microbacterium gorillae TaxID=1231063 RepID=UPI000694895A|nr:flavin reductase family protein [Microbacterium gorillae]
MAPDFPEQLHPDAPHEDPAVTAELFKAAFRGHPGGVAVITADAGDGPVALTATSVASVNADPPLLMFSVTTMSSATKVIVQADTVVVHLLDVLDLDLAQTGATKGIDRFADTSAWTRLSTGETVFHNVRAWLRCSIIDTIDADGSTVIAARVLQAGMNRDVTAGDTTEALAYVNRRWHRLGPASEIDAPTTRPS